MYYYHPTERAQWVVMVEGPVDWRECMLGVSPRDWHLELGLFSTGAIADDVRLRVWRSELTEAPGQWQALETLTNVSFQLSPLQTTRAATPDWERLASRCLAGLASPQVMHPLASRLGGVAYHSMWDQYRNIYVRPKAYIELICQASIARALHRAAKHLPLAGAEKISEQLAEQVIPRFFNRTLGMFDNTYAGSRSQLPSEAARREHAVVETWYSLSNLGDILYLSREYPHNEALRKQAEQAVMTWLAIGHEIGHVFPLFLDVTTREGHGAGSLNIAVGGLYADVMLAAAALLPHRADEFKAEAGKALTVLHRFPVQQMFHQPEMLARAAESAFRLSAEDIAYESIGQDFLRALLLMQYRDKVNGGLFEGCAGMMYPTFRESVASLMTLASHRDKLPQLPGADICDLGIIKCRRFLKDYGTNGALPVEGLATREMEGGGSVGTAIYAAGGVFDLAFLQKVSINPSS